MIRLLKYISQTISDISVDGSGYFYKFGSNVIFFNLLDLFIFISREDCLSSLLLLVSTYFEETLHLPHSNISVTEASGVLQILLPIARTAKYQQRAPKLIGNISKVFSNFFVEELVNEEFRGFLSVLGPNLIEGWLPISLTMVEISCDKVMKIFERKESQISIALNQKFNLSNESVEFYFESTALCFLLIGAIVKNPIVSSLTLSGAFPEILSTCSQAISTLTQSLEETSKSIHLDVSDSNCFTIAQIFVTMGDVIEAVLTDNENPITQEVLDSILTLLVNAIDPICDLTSTLSYDDRTESGFMNDLVSGVVGVLIPLFFVFERASLQSQANLVIDPAFISSVLDIIQSNGSFMIDIDVLALLLDLIKIMVVIIPTSLHSKLRDVCTSRWVKNAFRLLEEEEPHTVTAFKEVFSFHLFFLFFIIFVSLFIELMLLS